MHECVWVCKVAQASHPTYASTRFGRWVGTGCDGSVACLHQSRQRRPLRASSRESRSDLSLCQLSPGEVP